MCVQKTGIEVSKAARLTLLFYQVYCAADIYVAVSFNISADYIKIKFIFCNKYLYFILFLLKKKCNLHLWKIYIHFMDIVLDLFPFLERNIL